MFWCDFCTSFAKHLLRFRFWCGRLAGLESGSEEFAKAICTEAFNKHIFFAHDFSLHFTFAQQLIFKPPTFILHHLLIKSAFIICKTCLCFSFPLLKFLFHNSPLTYIDEISQKMFHNFLFFHPIFSLNFCTSIQ